MAIENNPFLKPKASSINLEANLPQTRDLGLTSEDRIDDPLRQKSNEVKKEQAPTDFVSRIEKSFADKPQTIPMTQNADGTFVAKPTSNIDFNQVNGKDISGPSSNANSKRGTNRFGGKAANAGITALAEAPNIIQNLNTTPETHEAALGKTLSLASSGASIGMSFGPVGALVGGAVGAGAGILSNAKWQQKLVAKNDKEVIADNNKNIAERQQNYFLNKTSEQIEAEMRLFKESQGILS